MQPTVSAYTIASALGTGRAATRDALRAGRSGLAPCPWAPGHRHVGEVAGLEGIDLGSRLAARDCRNSRVAEAALANDGFADRVSRARSRYGTAGIGVFIGTSTAGIRETEAAFEAFTTADERLPARFPYATTHRVGSVAEFVRARLGLGGPAISVATACSSSAKVFAQATRYLQAGLCQAAVVGGVDSLCRTTMYGFGALELTAPGLCRPFAADRDGMCIGEAGAFALLERAGGDIALLGHGESADAHHMSTPDPAATGARLALERALRRAALAPARVDYVNAHGTATASNDAAEDRAISDTLGTAVPVSSTKGYTGHTLGAAGAVELVMGMIALEDGVIPATLGTRQVDPALRSHVVLDTRPMPLRHVVSNSFGFGGNNCALVLGAAR